MGSSHKRLAHLLTYAGSSLHRRVRVQDSLSSSPSPRSRLGGVSTSYTLLKWPNLSLRKPSRSSDIMVTSPQTRRMPCQKQTQKESVNIGTPEGKNVKFEITDSSTPCNLKYLFKHRHCFRLLCIQCYIFPNSMIVCYVQLYSF